jgi:hypothetical protein
VGIGIRTPKLGAQYMALSREIHRNEVPYQCSAVRT